MTAQAAFADSFLRARSLLHSDDDDSIYSNFTAAPRSMHGEDEFNPLVFWAVNAFLIVILLSVCLYCWRFHDVLFASGYGGSGSGMAGDRESDQQYRRAVLERRRAAEERCKETPEKRKANLLASFARTQVTMVVEQGDLLDEITERDENPMEVTVSPTDSTATNGSDDSDDGSPPSSVKSAENALCDPMETDELPDMEVGLPVTDESMLESSYPVEECETGYLMLRSTASCPKRQVPNCCAVCLCPYDVGDEVVWSSNPHCKHAFHQDCMMDWLIKMRDGTPCPCCRQEFTDLEAHKQEKKIMWDPTISFNRFAIALR